MTIKIVTVTSPISNKVVLGKNEAIKLMLAKADNPKLAYKLQEVK